MTERHSLRDIREDLALPELAASIRLALGPAKLVFAFCGVVLVCSAGMLMDSFFRTVVIRQGQAGAAVAAPAETELEVYLHSGPKATRQFIQDTPSAERKGVFSTLWTFFSGRFHDAATRLLNLGNANLFANIQYALYNVWLCVVAIGWAIRFHPVYSAVFFSLGFTAAVFAGGAICRCAALEFAHDEKPGLMEAYDYTRAHWGSFLSAPLLPLGLMMVFGSLVVVLGLVAAIPRAGEILLALVFGVILIVGFLIMLMVLGTLAGGLLLLPSIAYEKTSGMDAIGRAFNYVLKRPAWMAFYVTAAAVFGTFFYLIVRFMIFVTLKLSWGLISLGMRLGGNEDKLERLWPEPEFLNFLEHTAAPLMWSESFAGGVIEFFMLMIVGVLLACLISYFFCSSTIIYALMRKKVDHVETARIYKHLEQVQARGVRRDHDETL